MAKQLVPDVAQFRMLQRFVLAGQISVDMMNIVYVRNTVSPWSGAHLTITAQALATEWAAHINPVQSTTATNVEIQAEDLGADPGAQAVVPMSGAGIQVGDVGPLQNCAIVRLRGEPAGEPRRGRIFLSGLRESDIDGNLLLATVRDNIDAAATDFYSSPLTSSDAFVLVSRFKNGAKRAQGVSNLLVPADTSCRQTIGSQRDRRR